jgi:hypothetical protein
MRDTCHQQGDESLSPSDVPLGSLHIFGEDEDPDRKISSTTEA